MPLLPRQQPRACQASHKVTRLPRPGTAGEQLIPRTRRQGGGWPGRAATGVLAPACQPRKGGFFLSHRPFACRRIVPTPQGGCRLPRINPLRPAAERASSDSGLGAKEKGSGFKCRGLLGEPLIAGLPHWQKGVYRRSCSPGSQSRLQRCGAQGRVLLPSRAPPPSLSSPSMPLPAKGLLHSKGWARALAGTLPHSGFSLCLPPMQAPAGPPCEASPGKRQRRQNSLSLPSKQPCPAGALPPSHQAGSCSKAGLARAVERARSGEGPQLRHPGQAASLGRGLDEGQPGGREGGRGRPRCWKVPAWDMGVAGR